MQGTGIQCKHCGTPLRRGVGVCPVCGSVQPRAVTTVRCRACRKRSQAALQVCPHCGRDLKSAGWRLPLQTMALGVVGVLAVAFLISRVSLPDASQALASLAPTITLPTMTPAPTVTVPAPAVEVPTDAPPPIEATAPLTTTGEVTLTVEITPAATLTTTVILDVSPTPTATATPTASPQPTATATARPATVTATASSTATPRPATATATRVPATATPVRDASGTTRYTIRAGDTLSAIAARFNTSVARLLALNPGLNPSRLQVGAQILVPGPGATATPAPRATVTPASTNTPPPQAPAPDLVGPASGSSYSGEDAVILLSWQVVAGLPDSMAYLVEIGFSLGGVFDWRVAEATTNASWRVSNLLYGQADQESGRRYSWRVVVVSVTRDAAGNISAWQRVGPPSEARDFLWN
ncbi:MAG: LysM peptidoglycan-binding domain-containing protein [Anaerolineae bacterium]